MITGAVWSTYLAIQRHCSTTDNLFNTAMWISSSYKRDYRDWIGKGQYQRIRERERRYLANALAKENPAPIATSLSAIATCHHTRGAVALLEHQQAGWHDIQAGYWAKLYALRFEVKAVTLPAWSRGRSFNQSAELAVTLAFSRLFQQTADRKWLDEALAAHFDSGPHVASGQPGHLLLTAMVAESVECTREDLLNDRRDCCRTRDAYPKRPTEVIPIGVIDIEAIIHYPGDAAFPYSVDRFEPTDDEQLADSIAAYHTMYPS
jgi:hypothetical protein